jgi:hypothetical protein
MALTVISGTQCPDTARFGATLSESISPEVDPQRIALLGRSFGGYLAPRAATADHRLAACIADAALYAPGLQASRSFPFALGDPAVLKPAFDTSMQDPTLAFVLKRGMLVHGVSTPWDCIRAFAPYALEGIADRIRCPTLAPPC